MRIRQLSWFPGQGWDEVAPSDEMASADFVLYFFNPALEDLPARLAELGEKFPGAAWSVARPAEKSSVTRCSTTASSLPR